MSDVNATLKQRGNVHGNFNESSVTKRKLMAVAEQSPNWQAMSPAHQCAVNMIIEKLGRVLHGDHEFADHWHDIAGYATLGERACDNVLNLSEKTNG